MRAREIGPDLHTFRHVCITVKRCTYAVRNACVKVADDERAATERFQGASEYIYMQLYLPES